MELGSVDDTMAGSSDIASGPALQVVVNGMIDAEIESDHGKEMKPANASMFRAASPAFTL